MATAEALADYLESRGLGTKGTDIFRDELRDEPDDAILIFGGGGLGAQRSHDLRRVLNPGVAITVRAAHNNYVAGGQKARDVYDALLEMSNTAFDGDRYLGCNPLGDITQAGRDERDRFKWTMNFVVKRA